MKNGIVAVLGLCLFVCSVGHADALFVIMGGYQSCSQGGPKAIGMHAPFQKMLGIIRANDSSVKTHYLVSCIGSEAPPNGRMEYYLSDAPGKFLTGNAADLMNEIETLYRDKGEPTVFIAGHSYGGWLAMYLAERLKVGKIGGLFTVDPIGTACGPLQYLFGGKACKEAPQDRNNPLIADNTNSWVNIYQDADSRLHSSPIPQAENLLVEYRGPHTEVDSDERTWQRISSVVLTTLKKEH